MKKILKGLGVALMLLLLLLAGTLLLGSARLAEAPTTHAVAPPPAGSEAVPEGRRLLAVHYCTECHGADLAGAPMVDAPAFGSLPAPNLTPAGVGASYGPVDWERAIRHGIGVDGRPLLLMPAEGYVAISDEELARMVAALEALPPAERALPARRIGPVPRILPAIRRDALLSAWRIDHDAAHASGREAHGDAALGRRLAAGCVTCHGADLAGKSLPFSERPAPNLTPDASGLGAWSLADFERAVREGIRPDGVRLGEAMPWRGLARLTDTELLALWEHLRGLPPVPSAVEEPMRGPEG